jgi:hypothetical protein
MFDPTTVQAILAGALGLTVLGVTEMVKRFLKVSGIGAYLVSLAVSAGATAYYLIQTHTFAVFTFAGYTIFVFLTANGIFKVAHTPTT